MAGNSKGDLTTYKKLIISSIAIFASLVFFGCLFEKTTPVASRILVVRYPVGDESTATLYGYGPADGITLLFYAAMALMLTSCIEDIVQGFNLSRDEDFSQQMTQILFYLSSILFGVYMLTKGNYDSGTFTNGFPDYNVPFLIKVFYLCQLGFLMQCFPQAMLQGLSPSESLTSLAEAEFLVLFLATAYAVNYTPMAAVVLMSHYAASLLLQLVVISSDSPSFKSCMKYALFIAEHIVILGAAICICMNGDLPGKPMRYLALAGALACTAMRGQTLYKDTSNTSKASSSSSSSLPLLPTGSASKKTRSRSKSRRGNGDRKSSRRRRR